MNHETAIRHLPDAGSGALDNALQEALAAHAASCPACRDWLATRDLLAEGLAGRPEEGREHPGSDLLALCAVRPQEMDEPDRGSLRRHLARCPTCRDELARVRAAVGEARPGSRRLPDPPVAVREGTGRAWALAAVLALALLAGLVVAAVFDVGNLRGTRSAEAPAEPALPSAGLPRPVETLSGQDLEGTRHIGRERSLVVSGLTVKSGADVTLCSGRVVAFGDGFRVDSGARLRVGAGPAAGGAVAVDGCRGEAR